MEAQQDLFADDHTAIGQMFDQLDQIPPAELVHRWPQSLAELIDVLACELKRQGVESGKASQMAAKQAGAVAHYLGGRSTYIPNGSSLKEALRDYLIYAQFNGRNVPDLCREFGLSESHIYGIIRQQRALIRRRYQRDLFDD
ncbi:transcriptional regulator [Testudinibacter sp. TR-2022]|uniref:Mor transcription activator family protein n=1 Tax=Testudinibacter sp. TR-2022 TaxID=2585029 RepID=UPI00111A3439|nr:Mor transcription activator family protein [Testudinibacter sp. TR-2022]TNH04506.1 transcriptional regulator [Pasteurellaceae bacterium Phil31]TNH11972.1 transcriptional regulator [Testudinibacter sp. TR-2022]TNH12723.1 transcriptional regulator [Testudinibacter sp. TR-2022]TNH13684.1 transcriptional regulator [Testudinibacter sp. TR-2022]TNH17234.1 transcriptional regulator [Testudinibacter sp. TR-2022]